MISRDESLVALLGAIISIRAHSPTIMFFSFKKVFILCIAIKILESTPQIQQ